VLRLLLTDCGLGECLHDRALYATSRSLWQDGYARGRPKQQRLADLLAQKLRVERPNTQGLQVRQALMVKASDDRFSLPEALDFATWAQRVERPRAWLESMVPPPVDEKRSRLILVYLVEAFLHVDEDVASRHVDQLRRRDLRRLTEAVENAALPLCTTAKKAGYAALSAWMSAKYLEMANSYADWAAAADLREKAFFYPVSVAAGMASLLSAGGAVVMGAGVCFAATLLGAALVDVAQAARRSRCQLLSQARLDARAFDVVAQMVAAEHGRRAESAHPHG
jgi:hypothetical protein